MTAIFNEIRNAQSEKKNTSVEGVTIQTTDQALYYCRHLSNSEIKLLTLQRIINHNPVEKTIPPSFVPIFNQWPPEKQRDKLDECVQALCRALFNKNASDAFWRLFEAIYKEVIHNPNYGVQELFQAIDTSIRNAAPDFDAVSLKYFIAVVKDGIQNGI